MWFALAVWFAFAVKRLFLVQHQLSLVAADQRLLVDVDEYCLAHLPVWALPV